MKDYVNTYVKVHPLLEYDPANKQGRFGKIIRFDMEKDSVLVRFSWMKIGHYSTDALLIPKDGTELYKELQSKGKKMTLKDWDNVVFTHGINDLLKQGKLKAANALSRDFEWVKVGMISLRDQLKIDVERRDNIQVTFLHPKR